MASTRPGPLCIARECPYCVHAHTRAVHPSDSSWGAGIVPSEFGTFCSRTLPAYVVSMALHLRSNSFTLLGGTCLDCRPTPLHSSPLESDPGTASTLLPSCVCPGIRLWAGALPHPTKASAGPRFNTPGENFPKFGCGMSGDYHIPYNPPDVRAISIW